MKTATNESAPRKRVVLRRAMSLAAVAAALCIAIIGNNVLQPQILPESSNSFTLRAFAMEEQSDGSMIPRGELEIDDEILVAETTFGIWENPNYILGGTGIDGEDGTTIGMTLTVGMGIRLDGDNIASATITTDIGHFSVNQTDFGWMPFERGINEVVLDATDLSAMLIWGYDWFGEMPIGVTDRFVWGESVLPNNVVITAVVTFDDGEVQEKSLTFNPSQFWGDTGRATAETRGNPPEPNEDGTFG